MNSERSSVNSQYPLKERVYSALAEIALTDEVTDETILAAVRNWTTDEPTEDGLLLGEDGLELSSYIISHIRTQMDAEEQFDAARHFRDKLNESNIDTDKLMEQDPEEGQKLVQLLLELREEQEDLHNEFPEEFTLDDILGAVDDEDAFKELATDDRIREILINRIDSQTRIGLLLHSYLSATLNNDAGTAHAIIDSAGCTLVHALTSLLLSYIQTRQTLPDDISLEEWVEHLRLKSKEAYELPDDEKVELAKHMMEMLDDGEEDL